MGKLAAAQMVRDDVIAALTAIADLMEPPPLMMVDPNQTLYMVPDPDQSCDPLPLPLTIHTGYEGRQTVSPAAIRAAIDDIRRLGTGDVADWLRPASNQGKRPQPAAAAMREARIAGYARYLERLSGKSRKGASHSEVAEIAGVTPLKVAAWIKAYEGHPDSLLSREFGKATIGLPAMTGAAATTASAFVEALKTEFPKP